MTTLTITLRSLSGLRLAHRWLVRLWRKGKSFQLLNEDDIFRCLQSPKLVHLLLTSFHSPVSPVAFLVFPLGYFCCCSKLSVSGAKVTVLLLARMLQKEAGNLLPLVSLPLSSDAPLSLIISGCRLTPSLCFVPGPWGFVPVLPFLLVSLPCLLPTSFPSLCNLLSLIFITISVEY